MRCRVSMGLCLLEKLPRSVINLSAGTHLVLVASESRDVARLVLEQKI